MGALYLIKFPNKKSYIGITSTTLKRRRVLHQHHARKGRKGALQSAIRKYGNFDMQCLVVSNDWNYLCEIERRAIAIYKTRCPSGYNMTDGGEGTFGVERSPEYRAKLSETKKRNGDRPPDTTGYRHTDEARAKISNAGKSRIFTKETRAKIGATKLGNRFNVGRPCKDETKRKISESQIGRPRFSEEQKTKMSRQRKGKPWTLRRRLAAEKTANL